MAHSENDTNHEGTLLVYHPAKNEIFTKDQRDVHLVLKSKYNTYITFCLNNNEEGVFLDDFIDDFPIKNIPLYLGGSEQEDEIIVLHRRPDLISNSIEIASDYSQKGTGIYVSDDEMIGQIGLYLELGHIQPYEFKVIAGFEHIDFGNVEYTEYFLQIYANETRLFGNTLESGFEYWQRLHEIAVKVRLRMLARHFKCSFSFN